METYSTTGVIKILQRKGLSLLTLNDFSKLFDIDNRQTLYKKIARLEKAQIVQKLIKGKYQFLFQPANDYTLANFLYQPSYVSLESALSFHGIITGFPYQITSISVKPTKSIEVDQKEFKYSQIEKELFWGYKKQDNFLLAEKEKALLDYIYFGIKGLRNLSFDEMDLSEIDKGKLASYTKKINNHLMAFQVKQVNKIVKDIL
jgi:predicted transcriptional regulator of viral defense system